MCFYKTPRKIGILKEDGKLNITLSDRNRFQNYTNIDNKTFLNQPSLKWEMYTN